MATKGVNSKSTAIRRILKEAQELHTTPSSSIHASPTESDLFSWHFTIRGPPSSPYSSGIYHGRIVLPSTYPMRPPSFRFMTPSGRFEVNREICLSISAHHEEMWMPAWGVRTALLALRSFMEQPSEGQVMGMNMDDVSRRKLADQSIKYRCEECGKTNEEILRESAEEAEKLAQAGGKKVEETVPEGLKIGYREDTEKKPPGESSSDSTDAELPQPTHNQNRSATTLSKASREDAETRAVAARATLAQVGITPSSPSQSGTSTPRAPTRSDSEDIRIAAMFPHVRPSPIPRAHQSPNQLEPVIGSPPQAYRRPVAAPGQGVPAPTGATSSGTSFHQDAFPPYLDSPQPVHPSHSLLSLDQFGGYQPPSTQPSTQSKPAEPVASGASSSHTRENSLSPSLIRAQADAAARYFESLGAEGVRPRPNGQPRTQVDPDRHIRDLLEQGDRDMGAGGVRGQQYPRLAPREGQQGQVVGNGQGGGVGMADVVWIDRLIAALVTVLLLLVVRYVGICLGE